MILFYLSFVCKEFQNDQAEADDNEEWEQIQDPTIPIPPPRPANSQTATDHEAKVELEIDQEDKLHVYYNETAIADDVLDAVPHSQFDLFGEIITIASRFGFDQNVIAQKFLNYTTDVRIISLPLIKLEAFWNFLGQNEEYNALSEFVKMNLAVSCSEAVVDRHFSSKRENVSVEQNRTDVELASARNTLKTQQVDDIFKKLKIRKYF
ncbi:hypothetical protein TVAG_352850 [Trichomonas vaginalis G3]|uniref:Uncharacterized protein n=1 Tax=Trichomonas vaginalis (strain ATCC PRA-98 / G3) TaxID=412133 RepID=A2EG87_TRIV3|nr:hypothetical protein TVAGG3_0134180 [Trichomonas vaginalis G3]EAY08363.1 hypothetical protein TVAG_352850 [Trichomonas vaginalis G3]KAI5546284.1 hypothetical protein TVAGG3_0134180 [Trichomonas vaginalis G3]|eukprot:XP_001320586.1 hypothetical protein [Trichomonas vaginalis G3]